VPFHSPESLAREVLRVRLPCCNVLVRPLRALWLRDQQRLHLLPVAAPSLLNDAQNQPLTHLFTNSPPPAFCAPGVTLPRRARLFRPNPVLVQNMAFYQWTAAAMSDAIKVLLLEHRQIAKVLELIEEQQINVAQHAPVNLRLLETGFDYLSDYPAECHHPKEDLIYGKLVKQIPDLAGSIKNLVEEHWKLAQLTHNLRRAIGESTQRAPDGRKPRRSIEGVCGFLPPPYAHGRGAVFSAGIAAALKG
jgi:hypothetical protein